MLMYERINKEKSKNGFTLTELVIVIAVLSVLAAIAIPVITTSINSAKLSVMESNAATVEMLIKEAINVSKADMKVMYNKKSPRVATVEDVLKENNFDLTLMEVKTIGDNQFAIYWDSADEGTSLHSGKGISAYDLSTKIRDIGGN